MEVIAVIAVEQTEFDERWQDLVEFAAAKTEGEQATICTITKRQPVAASTRAVTAPVTTLGLGADPSGDAGGSHVSDTPIGVHSRPKNQEKEAAHFSEAPQNGFT
jgi:hypothetical protein